MLLPPPLASRAFVLILAALPGCTTPRMLLIPRVQSAKLSGSLAASASGVSLVRNDLPSDLGLAERETEAGARLDLAFGRGRWTLAYAPASFSGHGTLSADVSADNVTLPATTVVDSKAEMNIGTALWTYDLLPSEVFELGLGLGLHTLEYRMEITDGSSTVAIDKTVPIPVLALRLGASFGQFGFSALASGLKATGGTGAVEFVDLDLLGCYRIPTGERLSLAAVLGWKQTRIDLDYTEGGDRRATEFQISGPYLGLSLGF